VRWKTVCGAGEDWIGHVITGAIDLNLPEIAYPFR
jgi:hypothetical protein